GNIAGADATLYGELYLQSSVFDANRGDAYFGTDTVPGQVVRVAPSQRGAVKGTRVQLTEPAAVTDVRLYAHAAGGHVRLGLYDDAGPRHLLWESPELANPAANAWVTASVAPGLTLAPGTYWLTWQVDPGLDV